MDVVIFLAILFFANIIFAPFAKRDAAYFLPVVFGALGAAGAAFKAIQAIKQNSLANDINPNDPTYQVSPYAKANLGLAQSLYNGRMAGATDLQRNIQSNQATTLGAIDRNATSSSQALALAGATQGQSNAAMQNLQMNEAQNKYALAGQVANANRDLTTEEGKVYQDQLRKYENDVQAKAALRQASANNLSGLFSDLTSGAMLASSFGGAGGGANAIPGISRDINPATFSTAPGIMTGLATQGFQQGSLTPGMMNQGYTAPSGQFFNPFNWKR